MKSVVIFTANTEFHLQNCPSCDKTVSFLSITKVRRANGKLTFTDVSNSTLMPGQSKMLA